MSLLTVDGLTISYPGGARPVVDGVSFELARGESLALAGASGADFLCYVTPAEHLRLPTLEDVRTGVIFCKIAAHAADLAKGLPGAYEWDRRMAECRKKMDWKGQIRESIDPETASEMRGSSLPEDEDVCTMCAEFCAIKKMRETGFVEKEETAS